MDPLSRLSAWQREGLDKTQGLEAHLGVPQIRPLCGCLSESVVPSLLPLICILISNCDYIVILQLDFSKELFEKTGGPLSFPFASPMSRTVSGTEYL